ncbi:MAG TPA: FAD-binding protein [Chloroflexota bacterium]|nr:FAD-binding protein [Chloroflexota bacterium]
MPATETISADVLVVGAGVAALRAAIAAREAGAEVVLCCKGIAGRSGNTVVSTADISAYVPQLGVDDSEGVFATDTLQTGGSIADDDLVQLLAERSGEALLDLERLGITLLRSEGQIDRTRAAGHSRARTYRADSKGLGPNKGLALSVPLAQRAGAIGVRCLSRTPVVRIATGDGQIAGAVAVDMESRDFVRIAAPAVVVAAGGASHLFARTNGTAEATGDAIVYALRAGAKARDLEFVQWHPTRMDEPVPLFLTNGLLADGAVFRDAQGRRFMPDYDERADLAPRDVLSKAVYLEGKGGRGVGGGVYLDCSAIPADRIALRHAYLASVLRERGVDFPNQWLVVSPATHFLMGGIAIDRQASSTVPGLFAAGESAGGIHGANRLGGNAFCEGLVFGTIAGAAAARYAADRTSPRFDSDTEALICTSVDAGHADPRPAIASAWRELRQTMWDHVSLVRTEAGLDEAEAILAALAGAAGELRGRDPSEAARILELRASIDCARLITSAARCREESRGAHWRVDFPETRPEWLGSIYASWPLAADSPVLTFRPKIVR